MNISITAQPLSQALTELARQTGATLVADPSLLQGKTAPAVAGQLSARQALDRLLAGSGLVGFFNDGVLTVHRAGSAGAAQSLQTVTVRARTDAGLLPPAFPGGQVARGGRIGFMGNADLMDVPMSIVSFTSEFRDNTQALSVSDMLKYSVSAQTPQAGAVPTTDVIYVRGFNIGSYDATFDGLPGLLGRMPPVGAVERVELLLGANAFANGQPGSVGGNINIVPKRAGDEPLYRVGANFRSPGLLGATVDAGQRFGDNKELGIRFNGDVVNGDTELRNGQRRAFSRALALDYRGDRARMSFDYMGNDRRLPAEAWFIVNPDVRVPDARRASRDFRQPWTYYKDWWDTAVVRGEFDLNERWKVSAAYGRMWTKVERLSQVSEIIDDAGTMQDAWGGSLGHSKQRREAYSGNIQVSGEFDTGPVRHRLQFGTAHFGDKGAYAGEYGDGSNTFLSNIYHPIQHPRPFLEAPAMPSRFDNRTRNSSLFVADEMVMFDDRLRVLVGARRVQYKSEYLDTDTGRWGGDPAARKWTPAFGVVFKPLPNVSLYANRLESLEAGYRVEEPARNAGTILPPLPARQIEIGAKAEFGKVGYTVALFEIDRPSYFMNPVTGIEGVNGRQVNRGLEFSVFGTPMDGLRLYGSATFLNPKMTQTLDGTYDGKFAVSAARFVANIYADWDVPGVPGLSLTGGLSHSGAVYNDEANTQRIRPWTRLDLGARYRTTIAGRNTVFRATLDNATDRQYWVSERGTIYMAPKRTLGLSMTMDL